MQKTDIVTRLNELKESDYRLFQIKSLPTVSSETIIGVRIPVLRRLAGELSKSVEREKFMNTLPHHYFEENMIHMMLITLEKDFDICVKELDKFLPYTDNWEVTDGPLPKIFKKKHELLIPVLEKWLSSDHVYTARYAINVYMKEFMGEDFNTKIVDLISRKRGEDYYLKMAIAWYFATALSNQYDAVIPYIEKKQLEIWTHNKTIQKAIESFCVTDEHKAYLRSLKIKTR